MTTESIFYTIYCIGAGAILESSKSKLDKEGKHFINLPMAILAAITWPLSFILCHIVLFIRLFYPSNSLLDRQPSNIAPTDSK